ncbi:uncharacterized protein LOC142539201 isoform X2 [Primulina tabacum]|uniref:uncharacterized protein LOC142539201 isoform X2 n=1 Tax=Primulina tabacum TaxID=48773 RepID=UPI003F594DE2
MKGDKMAKRSSFGNMMRRGLSDISNSLPQPKSPVIPDKLPSDATSASEYIDNLVKENMGLIRLIQEKNKILELSGIELQNLKSCLQKMQLQNWNLAQANSQMLAELNLGKDKIKALQHELLCKDALLKTKNLELAGHVETIPRKNELQESKMVAVENGLNKDSELCNANRRRSSRSLSLGSSAVSTQYAEKEGVANKRRRLRRQSASSRIQNQEPSENLFEIDDSKFPISIPSNSPTHILGSSSSSAKKDVIRDDGNESRTLFGRPSRRAAEKVQSYKEIPLNVKMRRSE